MGIDVYIDRLSGDRAQVIRDMQSLGWTVRRMRGKKPSWEFTRAADEGELDRVVANQSTISSEWMAHVCWRYEPDFKRRVVTSLEDWISEELEDPTP